MSMQRIFNYGSSLQAYGLKRLIESADNEAKVEFIDYRPGPPLVHDPRSRPPNGRWGRARAKVQEYADIDAPLADRVRFFNHKRTYPRHFASLGISKTPNYNLDLDLQLIGSDEVFNCIQANTNVGYARDLFGHMSPARHLASYAASFGNTTLEKINRFRIANELRADLSRFDSLSARDRNSARIITELTGRAPLIHVDPVIAYDFMGNEPRIPVDRLHRERYLIVYGYAGRLTSTENAALRAYADRHELEVLGLGGIQACTDRFIDADPFSVLAWFRDAEAVVTDTFHGTIFSLINHRPFVTIVRRSASDGYGNEEKLTHLLEAFGVRDRSVTELGDRDLDRLLGTPLDHGQLDAIITQERQRTSNYLKDLLARSAPS